MRGLEFDGTGEIEALALEHQALSDDGFEIDEDIVGIEFIRSGDDLNGTPSTSIWPAG
ncbi:hypothetical protein ACFQ2M_16405 [Kitasatospora saccharophila]|uniref:hypothetical protein n=1 Tax=Kitasatospora saccharophila TaxID=407973 RepID=UPI00363EAD5F